MEENILENKIIQIVETGDRYIKDNVVSGIIKDYLDREIFLVLCKEMSQGEQYVDSLIEE